jgi:peptide/nickel transport system substrate-binding protein
MRKYRSVTALVAAGALTLAVAACGGGSSSSTSGGAGGGTTASSGGGSTTASSGGGSTTSSSGAPKLPLKAGENAASESLTGGKQGGSLNVLSSEGFSHLDPGQSYFALDYQIVYVMQRPLLVYMPNSQTELSPDLATAIPSVANGGITDGGKTVTVHIQPNVKFAPPVNRVVTSADVKYAMERMANPNVAGGYWTSYFQSAIVGAAKAKGGPISGLVTPNPTTLVIHLTEPVANTIVQALSLPGTAPVPESVAGPLDKHAPTNFGVTQLTATGPYMIQGEQNGNSITSGYTPGKSLTLVRNPNWSASTYAGPYKPPAYLDQINITNGGDPNVIGPQVLKGMGMVQLDTPSKSTVQEAYEQYPSQITFTEGAGDHYMTLNNAQGPFANVNLRRAVYANLDRAAIIKEKGGELTGTPGTHFIYPGTAGFTEAGGYAGPNYPWAVHTSGDLAVAKEYMKKAGYPSGMYTGSATVKVVGSNNGADELAINQIVKQDMTQLGFKVDLIQVDQSIMYSKYCMVPKAEVDACPSGGWLRDFNDAFSILYPTFSTAAITPTANNNFGQVKDPTLDSMMQKAHLTVDPTQAAKLWGEADSHIVDEAEAVPEDFDIQPNVFSSNVHWVGDLWNEGGVNLAYTGLK